MKRLIIYLVIGIALLGLGWLLPHSLFSVTLETPMLTLPVPVETASAPAQPATSTKASCTVPVDGTKLLTNTKNGYCLLYPEDYSTTIPDYIVIDPLAATSDTPGEAWASISIDTAAGHSAAQIAEAEIAAVGSGYNITQVEIMVDGEPAIMVDGLPNVDSARKLFIVHNQRLYTLVFMPWVPNATEATPLEKLFRMVVDTLHFLS